MHSDYLFSKKHIQELMVQVYIDLVPVAIYIDDSCHSVSHIAFLHKFDIETFFVKDEKVWICFENTHNECLSREEFLSKYKVVYIFSQISHQDVESILYKNQTIKLTDNNMNLLDLLWKLGYYDQLRQILFESSYKYYHLKDMQSWTTTIKRAIDDFKKNFCAAPTSIIANERTFSSIGFNGYVRGDIEIFGDNVDKMLLDKLFNKITFVQHTPLRDNYFVLSTVDTLKNNEFIVSEDDNKLYELYAVYQAS